MKGDFSRFSFNPAKHFTGVRMQQGRMLLDADWNEQAELIHHQIRTLRQDVLGREGATTGTSYLLRWDEEGKVLLIEKGHYYVAGWLCQNPQPVPLTAQPFLKRPMPQKTGKYLAYLDVWQRQLTMLEDADLREIALGGADTTTRTQTVWQVRLKSLPDAVNADDQDALRQYLHDHLASTGGIRASRKAGQSSILENSLYRVEIHQGGPAPTFKWSRQNGAVAVLIDPENSVLSDDGRWKLQLREWERYRQELAHGNWVELSTADDLLTDTTRPLAQILDLDPQMGVLLVQGTFGLTTTEALSQWQMPLVLRLWDQGKPEVAAVQKPEQEATPSENGVEIRYIPQMLEHGIQINFEPERRYQSGDYWLLPARTLINDILWPDDGKAYPAQGIVHHYAPLAIVEAAGEAWEVADRRPVFTPLADYPINPATTLQRLNELAGQTADLQQQIKALARRLNVLYEEYPAPRLDTLVAQAEEGFDVAGIVVALDNENPHCVVPATTENATLVAGVVLQAVEGPDQSRAYLVASYGRAPCKVIGRVKPGDLLIPAFGSQADGAKAGSAMAGGVYLQPGTLIGKALQSFAPTPDTPAGLIEILVMLG